MGKKSRDRAPSIQPTFSDASIIIPKIKELVDEIDIIHNENDLSPFLIKVRSWLKVLPPKFEHFSLQFNNIGYGSVVYSGIDSDNDRYLKARLRELKALLTTLIAQLELNTIPKQDVEGRTSGSLEGLENALIEAIYDYILKNPTADEDGSRYIPEARKKAIKEDYQYQCQLCGNYFDEEELEIDHIFPYAFGGSSDPMN